MLSNGSCNYAAGDWNASDYTPKRLGWTLPPLISFLTSADLPTNHEGVLCLHVVISLLFFQFSRLS